MRQHLKAKPTVCILLTAISAVLLTLPALSTEHPTDQADHVKDGGPPSALYVDASGNIGVGTESPDAPLHVVSTVAGDLTMLHLTDNGNPRFRLTNSANSAADWVFSVVGVGFRISDVQDTTAEFQLDNSGNLKITGTLTTAGSVYPDYVFKNGYKPMPLADLAAYIKEHEHLPNVPSAADTEDGKSINMTELQIKTLEKVEELTLYTLDQQNVITEQQKLIRELQDRLAALENRDQ